MFQGDWYLPCQILSAGPNKWEGLWSSRSFINERRGGVMRQIEALKERRDRRARGEGTCVRETEREEEKGRKERGGTGRQSGVQEMDCFVYYWGCCFISGGNYFFLCQGSFLKQKRS